MNRDSVEKRKRGRPVGEVVRGKRCQIPLSIEEFETVDYLAKRIGKTKADIFREAFKMYNDHIIGTNLLGDCDKTGYEYFDDYDYYEDDEGFDEENW